MIKHVPILVLAALTAAALAGCAGLPQRTPVGSGTMGDQAKAVVQGCRPEGEALSGFRPGPQFNEELRNKVASEITALEGRSVDLPLTLNDDVRAAIDEFTGNRANFFSRSLARSGRYMPMMRRILKEKGLPEDLAYLPLIESGYNVQAVSPAKAAGLWQFIAATGKRYGLTIDEWTDERFHPEKATAAAADYLADLHEMFGSWYLAAAAYNAGEGKILNGLKKYNATNFWEIAEKNFLKNETKAYVPKFLAAVIIAKDPAAFGFTDIQFDSPERYDETTLPHPTDLDVIAQLAGVKTQDIQDLNPHLKLWCTPLNQRNFPVRLPQGSLPVFQARYADLKPDDRLKSSAHKVARGESLAGVARLYGLSATTLKSYNGLKSTRLKKGQIIRIPVGADVYLAKQKENQDRIAAEIAKAERNGNKLVYTVRSGDSPWIIAQRYNLDWKDIAAWNDIQDPRQLHPGQQLVLYVGGGPARKTESAPPAPVQVADARPPSSAGPARAAVPTYTVCPGDSISKIAHQFDVESREIREWNGLQGNFLRVGQVLRVAPPDRPSSAVAPSAKTAEVKTSGRVAAASAAPATDRATYTVQAEDTVWRIARRFGMTPEQLRDLNGLKDNGIRTGQVLVVAATAPTRASEPDKTASKSADITPGLRKLDEKSLTARSDAAPSAPGISPTTAPDTYTVQPNDNLWKIARRFNVDTAQIKEWNGLSDNSIRPGMRLKLRPTPGKTAAQSAPAAPRRESDPGGALSYKVQSGDTLWKIAQRFKVDPAQIRNWNQMPDNNIRPGDVLTIRADRS